MLGRVRTDRKQQRVTLPPITADPAADRTRARFDFLAREYDTVRAEHLASRSAQQAVVTAALASAAAVFVGLLSVWKKTDLRIGILSLAPLFLAALWGMWFGEVVRIARTSLFLWELEQVVNAELRDRTQQAFGSGLDPASALHWEGWMRGANPWKKALRARMSYILTYVALLGTGLISTVLSLIFSFMLPMVPFGLKLTACVAGAAWLIMFGYALVSARQPLISSSWDPTPRIPQ